MSRSSITWRRKFVNWFEAARQVPMPNVITHYAAVDIVQRGTRSYALCPFHPETRPSMLIDDRRFHCFGCGTGGDGTAFVSKLFNITALEAAKMICSDFVLLPVGDNASYRQRPAADVAERRKKDEAAIRRQKIDIAGKYLSLVVRMIDRRLRTPDDLERFGVLAQALGEAETLLDMLSDKDTITQDLGLSLFQRWWLA